MMSEANELVENNKNIRASFFKMHLRNNLITVQHAIILLIRC
jgi:hypothetical protein